MKGLCPICREDLPRNPRGGEIIVVSTADFGPAPVHADCHEQCFWPLAPGQQLKPEIAARRTIPYEEVVRRIRVWKQEQQSGTDSPAAPPAPVVPTLSSRWDDAISDVRSILTEAPKVVTWPAPNEDEPLEIEFVAALEPAQVGYSHSPDGESLMGGDGAWREEWLVVGLDSLLGDPVFVDLSNPAFPVYYAAHGGGVWEPERLAPSLRALIG